MSDKTTAVFTEVEGLVCTINVVNFFGVEIDDGMMGAVMRKVARCIPQARFVTVHVSERDNAGWLEWMLVIITRGGSGLTIGCIQRKPEAEYEFHS